MILVTGGAGYLGSHVVNALDNAMVYDLLLYADEYRKDVEFVRGDVTDYDGLRPLLDRADAAVWLAAIVGDGACAENPARAIEVNQEAVRFLADNYGGPIAFTSTCSVYGANDDIATEETPPNPLSLYAETKLRAEEYLKDKQALILRLGTLHGVSERMRFDLVVNAMTKSAVMEGVVTVFGGEQYRPLLSVRDAANIIAHAVLKPDWQPGVYNLASNNLPVVEIADYVTHITNANLRLCEMDSEDRRSYRVSSSKVLEKTERLFRNIDESIRNVKWLIESGRLKNLEHPHYYNARRK
jgi:nucleoside-diphosphate-sugar epimerase